MTNPENAPRQIHKDEPILISELADEQGWVRKHDFLRCTILGPALLMLSGGTMDSNRIYGSPNECLYYVEEGRQQYPGAIIVFQCSFQSCTFQNVGFTGPSDHLDAFKGATGPL